MAVLYRKYRPQNFSEVIGQAHIVQTLINSIKNNNISHAYLFSGPRGSGKTSIARVFAKAINCQKPHDAEPCNKCSSCLEISQGNSLDLIEIDAASHRGIDDIRELKEGIKFSPVKSKYKIFIIDECHQLSKDAANALLKTLEEPPSHAMFILATTEANKMIQTIVSRCQRFDFKKLNLKELVEKLKFILKKENVKFEEATVLLIAQNARGSLRDAESLLDKCMSFSQAQPMLKAEDVQELLGIVEISQVATFFDLVVSKKAKEAIMYLNEMIEKSIDLNEFVKTFIYYLREALMLKMNPDMIHSEDSVLTKEELQKISADITKLSHREIKGMMEAFIEAENKMKYANILQLPLELAVLDIIESDENK